MLFQWHSTSCSAMTLVSLVSQEFVWDQYKRTTCTSAQYTSSCVHTYSTYLPPDLPPLSHCNMYDSQWRERGGTHRCRRVRARDGWPQNTSQAWRRSPSSQCQPFHSPQQHSHQYCRQHIYYVELLTSKGTTVLCPQCKDFMSSYSCDFGNSAMLHTLIIGSKDIYIGKLLGRAGGVWRSYGHSSEITRK